MMGRHLMSRAARADRALQREERLQRDPCRTCGGDPCRCDEMFEAERERRMESKSKDGDSGER